MAGFALSKLLLELLFFQLEKLKASHFSLTLNFLENGDSVHLIHCNLKKKGARRLLEDYDEEEKLAFLQLHRNTITWVLMIKIISNAFVIFKSFIRETDLLLVANSFANLLWT